MPESKDSLDEILQRVGGQKKPSKNGDSAPSDDTDAITFADMNGTAMRPANKNLTRLHIVTKDGKVRSFQYHYLDVESRFDGDTFTLLFVGSKHWQVTVKGRGKRFWAVYDYITLHRWPYLREETGSMPGAAEGEAVFTSIDIKDVTPQPEG